MLQQLIMAAVVVVAVFLLCTLAGMVTAGLPPLAAVGAFLAQWAWAIGLLAGVAYYFRGRITA